MRIFQLMNPEWMNKRFIGLTLKTWLPILIVLLLIAGLFSPLFDLSQIHGVANPKLYFQHFYFDFVAGLGGYWAASFCQHWYHRIPLFIFIDVLTTFALVTLIG